MPIIARFIQAAEAAVFQTLLEEKGIPSTLLHSGPNAIDRNDTATIAIEVPDEHASRALDLHAVYTQAVSPPLPDPAKPYSFLTVWAFVTLAIMLFSAALCVTPLSDAGAETDTCLAFLALIFVSSIFWGLVVSGGIALARKIPAALKSKTGAQD